MRGPPDSLGRTAAQRGRRLLTALAAAFALSLAACASIDPPPAPVSVAPAAAPRAVAGVPASPERKRLIDAFGGVYGAPATEAYLNGVLVKLAPASDAGGQPYRVTMLNSQIVNAFALPSGDIFVTRGLLALADDTSEIAAVMAHEIGHITARHAAQRAEFEKTTALFTKVNTQLLAQRQAQDEAEARSKLAIAELFPPEATSWPTKSGIKTIAKAGYDPYAAARFLTALGEWSALRVFGLGGRTPLDRPDMMVKSTRPRPSASPRRPRKRGTSARRGSGEVDRNGDLAAIDGLAFSDHPSQGVARDNAFIHPNSGFAFDVLVWLLGRQPVGGGAHRGWRSQPARLSASTASRSRCSPRTSAIGSGWIDGVKIILHLNRSRSPAWRPPPRSPRASNGSFRVGAIRLNGRLYRLIFAAHTLSPGVDLRFMASLDSFHLINAQDLATGRAAEDQDRRGGKRRTRPNPRRTNGSSCRGRSTSSRLSSASSGATKRPSPGSATRSSPSEPRRLER